MKFIEIIPLEKILARVFPLEHIVEDKFVYLSLVRFYQKLLFVPFSFTLLLPITKARLTKTDKYYFLDIRNELVVKYWFYLPFIPFFALFIFLFAKAYWLPPESWEIIFWPLFSLVIGAGIGLIIRKGLMIGIIVLDRNNVEEENTSEGVRIHGNTPGMRLLTVQDFDLKKVLPLAFLQSDSTLRSTVENYSFWFSPANSNDPFFFKKNYLIFLTLYIAVAIILLAIFCWLLFFV
jgi:hypothetical protein